MVEGRDLLGDRHRMPQRQKVDIGAEHQPAADHGGLGQLQERIEDRHRKGDVVADPQRIVAAIIDQPDQPLHFVDPRPPGVAGRLGAPVDRLDADAEPVIERQFHASLLRLKQCSLGTGLLNTPQREV